MLTCRVKQLLYLAIYLLFYTETLRAPGRKNPTPPMATNPLTFLSYLLLLPSKRQNVIFCCVQYCTDFINVIKI